MFPEGKRSKDFRLQQGFPGAALIALQTGVPVVPIALTGTENIYNLKWAFFHHPTITVTIGKPFQPAAVDKPTREQRNQLCDEMMYKLAELLPPSYRGVYGDKKTDN